ncbi:MAG: FTR1 family protein [Porticoccus sp.]|nr:FTR1 family protein [Porticoccus sp.]
MFLNSVVLILQEILEAALLISVLLVFMRLRCIRPFWIIAAIAAGSAGAYFFALQMASISEWFDYMGQEVVNASIQLTMLLILATFVAQNPGATHSTSKPQKDLRIIICTLLLVALSLTREGSEVFIYISGVIGHPSHAQPTLTGSGIGAGIGISAGVLIYYGLLGLPTKWIALSGLLLLSLVGGNMTSQATQLLTQADWLPYSKILWDSSDGLPENSILGHLLYALFGYEATPSLLQVFSYIAGMLLIYLCAHLGSRKVSFSTDQKTTDHNASVSR